MDKIWDKIKQGFSKPHGITAIGITDIGGNAIAAIFWFYIATLLGADHYGQISYYLSIAGIVSSLSLVGASNTLYVYTSKNVKIHAPIYFISLLLGTVSSVILFFIFHNLGLSIVALGYVIFNLSISGLLGSKSYREYFRYVISQKILMVCLAVGFYYWLGLNGVILGIGLSLFPYVIRLYKGFREEKIDFSLVKERLGFIMNSYLLDLSAAFITSIDKIIIAPLLGFVLLGNYQLAIQFLTVLYIIPNIFYKFILPHESSGNSTKNIKIGAVIVSVILAALGVTLSPFVLPALFPKFTHVVTVLQIVSISVIPNTINLTFMSKFLALEKSKVAIVGSGLFIFVQVISIIILGQLYGIIGVGIALVLAESIQTIYFVSMRKFVYVSTK